MIFHGELAHKVIAGRKHQARFKVKADETACPYRRDRTYSVQSRAGGRSLGRVQILGAQQQRLGDITESDIRAEGFKHRIAFFRYWAKLHGSVDQDEQVWAVAFVPVDQERFLPARLGQPPVTDPLHAARADQPTAPELQRQREPEPTMVPKEYEDELVVRNHEKERGRRVEIWEQERANLEASITRLDGEMDDSTRSELRVMRRRLGAIDRKLRRAA